MEKLLAKVEALLPPDSKERKVDPLGKERRER